MSQSCPAHFFRCAFDSAKFKVLIFLLAYFFFQFFYELACQNILEKIWQTQRNTLNNRLLQLCVLSCIWFIQNQVPYFKAVDDSNLTRLLLRKKNLLKKTHLYRSGLAICHELWDIAFIFFLALSWLCVSKQNKTKYAHHQHALNTRQGLTSGLTK